MTLPQLHHPTPSSAPAPAPATASASSDYAARVAQLRSHECPQLDDALYLDAAASPPYPAALVHRAATELATSLFSNPHSKSPSALDTASRIEHARHRVLTELFCIHRPHDWHLVFTAGTTASLRLVADAFDWSNGDYHHLLQSHTSLAAIRDIAANAGARTAVFEHHDPPAPGPEPAPYRPASPSSSSSSRSSAGYPRADLVALPLQCNATGTRYDALLATLCRQKGSRYVLVDAASYLSSSQRLDLGSFDHDSAPDFVAFSFYKVFGYPTGLGALLVKKSSAHALSKKAYYGGGTLDAIAPWSRWKQPRTDLAAAFEDGTPNIHAILALRHAFDYYQQAFGPWQQRADYVRSLGRHLHHRLAALRHGNGAPVVRIYTDADSGAESGQHASSSAAACRFDSVDATPPRQGPICSFNVLSPAGRIVPPNEVDRLASISNIHIRAGRHCNAGFVASSLGATDDDIKQQYADGVGCDESSDSDQLVSTSLRASVCLLNTHGDVDRLAAFIERFFQVVDVDVDVLRSMASASASASASAPAPLPALRLSQVIVYPIKSCAGQRLCEGERWPLTRHGLEYDREWVVLDLRTGKGLSQKKHPRMALIQPRVERRRNKLVIAIAGRGDQVEVDLEGPEADGQYDTSDGGGAGGCGMAQVCADAVRPSVHTSTRVRTVLSEHLGVACTLARLAAGQTDRHSKLTLPTASGGGGGRAAASSDRVPLLLSNESPFLLINQVSVDEVSAWMQGGGGGHSDEGGEGGEGDEDGELRRSSPPRASASSFRSNFVIAPLPSPSPSPLGPLAFIEDGAARIRIGWNRFGVLGQCRRCQMVCVDQATGEVRPQTFKALARHRRNERGRIIFGSHLVWLDGIPGGGDAATAGLGRKQAGVGFVEVGMPVVVEQG